MPAYAIREELLLRRSIPSDPNRSLLIGARHKPDEAGAPLIYRFMSAIRFRALRFCHRVATEKWVHRAWTDKMPLRTPIRGGPHVVKSAQGRNDHRAWVRRRNVGGLLRADQPNGLGGQDRHRHRRPLPLPGARRELSACAGALWRRRRAASVGGRLQYAQGPRGRQPRDRRRLRQGRPGRQHAGPAGAQQGTGVAAEGARQAALGRPSLL